MLDNIRSSYGIVGRGNTKTYSAQLVSYRLVLQEARTKTLRHTPFSTATLALQYATRVRQRLQKLMALGKCDEALCLCGHIKANHLDTGKCCGPEGELPYCACVKFIWVWSEVGVAIATGTLSLADYLDWVKAHEEA